jgi:glutamate synthase domain-containing protein 1
MCGIVALYLKTERHEFELGRLTALMLHEMRDRGPDSAGFAIYSGDSGRTKTTVLAEVERPDWNRIRDRLAESIGGAVGLNTVDDHAVFETDTDGRAVRQWFTNQVPDVAVLSYGRSIEMYKAVGDPTLVAERYKLSERTGTHAIGHTRMATESAITTNGSHPFSTGDDTCLVHNGSLSNHNNLREILSNEGETFETDNDSEVAAGYLSWRLRTGDTLEEALECALRDLDGFYTFAVGVRDGFAVVRDPIACKPAIIAETQDWVAMSSEYRAIAQLPDVDHAEIWEPQPATVYAWSR